MVKAMRLGDYEVLGELGRGGSARVYRGRGPDGAIVAIKLLPGVAGHDAYSRFAREQRLLAGLGEAEGFVPLIGTGVSESGPFFVMPLLPGGTLRDRLEAGRVDNEGTVQLARQLATAIGWAHERGIVHRDLKPENILFTHDRRPLIADLGIAKHFIDATTRSESITEEGSFLGTPAYMAPEQMDCSKTVDPRADVYALGALLYECLTGKPPFEGTTIQELVACVTKGDYKRVQDVCKDAPLDLVHPIGIALNHKPEFRYENGFAFAHALGVRLPQRARLHPTNQELPRRRPRRSPVLWAGPLLLIGGALLAGHGAPAPAPRDAATTSVSTTASPTAPRINAVVAKGWFGEPLPERVRVGGERPLYIFDTKKGLEIELVYVPPGDFFMGAINGGPQEKPLHTHAVKRGFYMGHTEVTWGQYLTFCRASQHREPARPTWPTTVAHPVVNVSWRDATAFCEWAGLSLPTEPEWEKAARGGADTRQWPWGEEWSPGKANVLDTTNDGARCTAPVGSFRQGISPYGALDMAGNVFEWTADHYDAAIYLAYSNGRTDPPTSGQAHTIRGGGWNDSRFNATTTFRLGCQPDSMGEHIGFRAALRAGRE